MPSPPRPGTGSIPMSRPGSTLMSAKEQGKEIRLQASDLASADIVPYDGQALQVWGVVTNAIKSMPV